MKILKRNQLIILVISLMLITSGYLNFTANNKNVTTETIADRSDERIGDAEFVSTIPKEDEANVIAEALSDQNITEENLNNESNENNETKISNANVTEDYYFTTSKLERNNMYSENLESYQEIYNKMR